MSYIRGDYYLWGDDSSLHIWAHDGYDNWDESVWNEGSGESNAESRPSGTAVPFTIADEFAVMRVAQLLEAGQLTEVVTLTRCDLADDHGLALPKVSVPAGE